MRRCRYQVHSLKEPAMDPGEKLGPIAAIQF